jgi:hypothetical protein
MFKAAKEFTIGDAVIAEGQEVKNPTVRMKELGLVVEVQDEQPEQEAKTEKPKKEKKEKKEVEKVEEVKTETTEVKDEILTEDSANITVEKTEE